MSPPRLRLRLLSCEASVFLQHPKRFSFYTGLTYSAQKLLHYDIAEYHYQKQQQLLSCTHSQAHNAGFRNHEDRK
jgi:hypothetical protein